MLDGRPGGRRHLPPLDRRGRGSAPRSGGKFVEEGRATAARELSPRRCAREGEDAVVELLELLAVFAQLVGSIVRRIFDDEQVSLQNGVLLARPFCRIGGRGEDGRTEAERGRDLASYHIVGRLEDAHAAQ